VQGLLDGGRLQSLIKETVFRKEMHGPRWSRDGQRILAVEGKTRMGDIVICSVKTGECRKLAAGGLSPIWSGDESRVFFQRFKGFAAGGGLERRLLSVSVDGSDEKLEADLKPLPLLGRGSCNTAPTAAFGPVRATEGSPGPGSE
jgi:hypothetical protein